MLNKASRNETVKGIVRFWHFLAEAKARRVDAAAMLNFILNIELRRGCRRKRDLVPGETWF